MSETRIHPLLRSAPEVRVLLAGATMFRVPVKVQPDKRIVDGLASRGWVNERNWFWRSDPDDDITGSIRLPWAPGDLLWVKETWAWDDAASRHVEYRATWRCERDTPGVRCEHGPARWRSPVTMPRWASRLTLRVTDVRVQRVQDATPGDACAEGVTETGYFDEAERLVSAGATMPAERLALALQFDATHGKRAGLAWADNPWVVATTVERVEAQG